MVIMVKISHAEKLACSSGTAMVTMVRIFNVKNSQIVRDSHGHNGQDFQCKNVSRRQKHSHGHNGQDCQCEK